MQGEGLKCLATGTVLVLVVVGPPYGRGKEEVQATSIGWRSSAACVNACGASLWAREGGIEKVEEEERRDSRPPARSLSSLVGPPYG